MIAKLLKKSLLMFLSAVIAIGGALLVGCGRLGNAETKFFFVFRQKLVLVLPESKV